MLPNNQFSLSISTENQLKKLSANTGITRNILARVAFFRSVEGSFRFDENRKELQGSLKLGKNNWLGETTIVAELLLKLYYPNLSEHDYVQAWAAHVEDGLASIRNHESLSGLSFALSR
ncbi:DNA sulfur modification protein DndE [Vibrio sp. 10N.222.55.F12]|uniref:DNA sulfur modification protein DndE n=1 Tax=Vibrio sp. 10N.222.55.F12 TaxID=3229653 RepID=UPI003551DC13